MTSTPSVPQTIDALPSERPASLLQRAAWQRVGWAALVLGVLWLALWASMSAVD